MNCDTLLHDMDILDDGTVFPDAAKLKQMAVHSVMCEDCQTKFMLRVLEWEQKRPIPPPPQAIARWRLVAQHMVAESKEDEEAVTLPWGWQLDRDQNIWWWRFESQEFEALARTAWSFAGDQALQMLRWFVAVRLLTESTSHASSSPGDDDDLN